MPKRAALPLALVLIALAAAWILLGGGGGKRSAADGPGAHADAPAGDGAAATGDEDPGAPAATGGDAGAAGVERAAHAAGGLGGSAAPAHPEHGIPSFTGRVVDAEGAPVAGATVEAFGFVGWAVSARPGEPGAHAHWTATTAADGGFALPEAPRDGLRFLVEVRAKDAAPRALLNLPAVPGRTRALGTIPLGAGFAVTGRVLTHGGEAVAGATVRAFHEARMSTGMPPPAEAAPVSGAIARSGADGRFTLEHLPAGVVRLHAAGEGWTGPWSGPLAGAAGARLEGVEIVLQRTRTVSGTVRDPAGAPVAGALVRLQDLHASAFRVDAESGADGGFDAALPADAQRVRMTVAAPGHWLAARTLDAAALRERIVIALQPMPALEGTVVDGEGAPVAGAEVVLAVPERELADARSAAANARATSGADGGFRLVPDLRHAWDGRFVVRAWTPRHAPAQSEPILVRSRAGARVPELRLVLAPGRRVAGTVEDPRGQAVPGARVHLRRLRPMAGHRLPNVDPSRARGAIVRSATTGADGGFAFDGLAVADYRVEAHAPGHSPGESEEFPLVEDREDLVVPVHASSGIAGRVHGAGELALLRVTLLRPGTPTLDALVDSEGRFAFEDVAPGDYELELRPAAAGELDTAVFLGGTEPLAEVAGVEVPPGAVVPVRLKVDLSGRGGVQGRVQVDGRRAPDHRVVLLPLMHPAERDPRLAGRRVMRQLRHASSDAGGRWRIPAVPAGDYWAVLCAPGRWPEGLWSGGWGEDGPAGLARQRVTVRAGETAAADFALQLGGLRIEVANPDQDVETLLGRLDPAAAGVRRLPLRVGPGGVLLRDLPAGAWTLRLYAAGFPQLETPVTVTAGRVVSVPVTLPLRR